MIEWLVTLWLVGAMAPLAFLWCCCSGCAFFSDVFAGSDLSSYTQESGVWSLSGGTLTGNGPNASIIVNTAVPDPQTTLYGTVEVECASSGDVARFVFLRTDANNLWFAELKPGSSDELKLFRREDGTDAQIGVGKPLDGFGTNATLVVCVTSGTVRVAAQHFAPFGVVHTASIETTHAETVTGTTCGLGVKSGTVKFRNLSLERHKSEDNKCLDCPQKFFCVPCVDTQRAWQTQVVIVGLANGVDPIGCDAFNGTWLFDTIGNDAAFQFSVCKNMCGAVVSASFGSVKLLCFRLRNQGGQVLIDLWADIDTGSGFIEATWTVSLGTLTPTCLALHNVPVSVPPNPALPPPIPQCINPLAAEVSVVE